MGKMGRSIKDIYIWMLSDYPAITDGVRKIKVREFKEYWIPSLIRQWVEK